MTPNVGQPPSAVGQITAEGGCPTRNAAGLARVAGPRHRFGLDAGPRFVVSLSPVIRSQHEAARIDGPPGRLPCGFLESKP